MGAILFPAIPVPAGYAAILYFSSGYQHAVDNGDQLEGLQSWEMEHGHSLIEDSVVLLHHLLRDHAFVPWSTAPNTAPYESRTGMSGMWEKQFQLLQSQPPNNQS